MTDAIPPLPDLEITEGTKQKGFTQETIDLILRIFYERKPDFFTRVAQREDDFPGKTGRDPNAGPNDALVQEFQKYMSEDVAKEVKNIDFAQSKFWTRVFWEMRRRARLMYGMRV